MQVSSNTNQYQSLQAQQQPITIPVEPNDPKYSNKEVYDASQGNVIRGEQGNLVLTPQGDTNLNSAKDEKAAEVAAETQAQKDSARESATGFLEASSKKSQVEIYLAVATDGKASQDNATADVISELRDVQKQNNTVQAYATYQEAQNNGTLALF
jgi:hypothetical protein